VIGSLQLAVALATLLGLAGCSLLVDFDRSRIAASDAGDAGDDAGDDAD
jgi:hypothetical protein